jgi:hypothetical protein
MLDFTSTDIAGPEIRYARDERDRILSIYGGQLASYTTGFWKNSEGFNVEGDRAENPENAHFEFIALMKPRLAYQVPTVTVTTARRGPRTEEVAIGAKHAGNRWLKDTKYNQLMGQSCVDFSFNHSVLHVSITENEFLGGDGKLVNRHWPEVNRVSQRDYWCDPSAKSYDLCRFEGHDELLDKDDLLATAKEENKDGGDWDLEAIEGIAGGEPDSDTLAGQPGRNQVLLTAVWVRGYEGKDHPGEDARYYGTVFTFGSSTDADEDDLRLIHEPEPFYGPPSGPYEVGSAYLVPDSPYGVSSLTANEGSIRDLNKHARAVSGSAERMKNLVLADNTDPNFAGKIANAEHDSVLEIEGLDRERVLNIQVGGTTAESLNYLGLAKERLDRNLGISEAMRGVTKGDTTATAEALASQGGDVRIAGFQAEFIALHDRVLSKVLWYMLASDEYREVLPPEALEEMGLEDGAPLEFVGGFDPDSPEDVRPEDLELHIEVSSVAHISEPVRQQRAQVAHQVLSSTAQMAIAAPWINWENRLRRFGEAFGMPDLADDWDQELYEQFVARQLQMEFTQSQTADPEARLSSHPGPPEPSTPPFEGVAQSAYGSPTMPGQSMGAEAGAMAQGTAQPSTMPEPGGF